MPKHQRLKSARIRAGYKTARAAASKLEIPYGTYSGHEGGSRGIKEEELKKYADFFGVSASWLAFGQESTSSSLEFVVIAGTAGVAADGSVNFYKGSQIEEMPFDLDADLSDLEGRVIAGAKRLPMPSFMAPVLTSSLSLVAIKIAGDKIENYRDIGGVLYFEIERYEDLSGFRNVMCLCWLKDGMPLISKLTPNIVTDRGVVSVSPLVCFLTRAGLSRWLETLAASFFQSVPGFDGVPPD